MRTIDAAARSAGGSTEPELQGARVYDIRSRQEVLHRRQVVSLLRRTGRVLGLHAVDGSLIAGSVVLLSSGTFGFTDAGAYVPAITAVFLLALNALSAYSPGDGRRDRQRLLSAVGLAVLLLGCFVAFPPNLPLAWSFLASLGALVFVALALGRKLVDQLVRQFYLHGIGLRRALLIGNLDEVGTAIHQLRDDQNIDQYLVGHLAPEGDEDPTALGMLTDLPEIVQGSDVQEVIVATVLPVRALRNLAEFCFSRNISLFVFPALLGGMDCKAEPVRVGRCPMLHVFPPQLDVGALMLKRTLDGMLALIALVLVAPLMAIVALLIKMDSPGPVFFRQERIGQGGRRFRIWKFRTMRADAEEVLRHDPELLRRYLAANYKLSVEEDPRVSRVGAFLRRTSIDELPQLFNVITGEMSLVGPRPVVPAEIAHYGDHAPVVLAVRPGITGHWQVSGRSGIGYPERAHMDVFYVLNWSLEMDLSILFRTVPYVLTRRGVC